MTTVLRTGRGMESVLVQAAGGIDGQGKPTYGASVTIKARVVRESVVVLLGDGSQVKSVATLWIDAGQPVLPKEQDQLALTGGTVLVVVIERMERVTLGGVLDHVRLRCRAEGV